jgi:hypothetical protein
MSEFKAQAHARELKQRLQLSVSDATLSDSLDESGLPVVKLEKGSESIFVKISLADNAGRVDGLGLPQRVYSPHIAQVLQEESAAATELETRAKVLAACAKLGMKLEVWEAAGPTSFDLSGATKIATIASDEIHPLVMSQ